MPVNDRCHERWLDAVPYSFCVLAAAEIALASSLVSADGM